MMSRNICGAVLLGAILSQAGWAQEPQPPDQNGQNDTASPDQRVAPAPALAGGLLSEGGGSSRDGATHGPVVPAIVGGYGSSLAFTTEMQRSNYIRGGASVQNAFTNNSFLTPTGAGTNDTLSVFPHIALDQSRPRVHWLLSYAGGYSYNSNLRPQNFTSQDLDFDLQYRLSPHTTARVSELVSYTSGVFVAPSNFSGTIPGVPEGSNPFIATPLSTQFGNLSRGEIGYQLSAGSAVGASGGYNVHRFSNLPPDSVLLNTQSENAAGFYMHRILPGNWLGVSYTFQQLTFSPTPGETFIHSAFVFDTIALRENMSLTFFAGPQYSDDTAPVSFGSQVLTVQKAWSGAGGASYSWQGSNTSVTVDVARRLSDGAGLLGTAEVNSATGAFRRRITRNWSAEAGASFAINDALNPALTDKSSIRSAAGEFDVARQFSEKLFLRFGYVRQFQSTTAADATRTDANRNQFLLTLTYQFTRPWGR